MDFGASGLQARAILLRAALDLFALLQRRAGAAEGAAGPWIAPLAECAKGTLRWLRCLSRESEALAVAMPGQVRAQVAGFAYGCSRLQYSAVECKGSVGAAVACFK